MAEIPSVRGTLKTRTADACLVPFTVPAAALMAFLRRHGLRKFPRCRAALWRAGVHPLIDHYYEPLFKPGQLLRALEHPRRLPGIDWHIDEQLDLLGRFVVDEALAAVPRAKVRGEYFFDNDNFGGGDGDALYHMIRHLRPKRLYEVGSGFSTLMARRAIEQNEQDSPGYSCEHVCIEPYEMAWLESRGVRVIRDRVEALPTELFSGLAAGDLLFIDSSHVLRPQGDVTYLFLEVLPLLRPGVVVHVHDIFSPREYPAEWLFEMNRLWNEQYLVESLLSGGQRWRVLLSLNLLWNDRRADLLARCPGLSGEERPPTSLYLLKSS
jgi:hypothetical protein